MGDFAAARRKMVDTQLRTSDVTDNAVLAAMGAVPREVFVSSNYAPLAYIDEDLPIGGDSGRYVMRPAAFAKLAQAAEIAPSDVVLLVGGGSGYEAAVLARLASSVVVLEQDPDLARIATARLAELEVDSAVVVVGPLPGGWPAEAPYDVILVAGATQANLDALATQLREGGRMVVVEGTGGAATAQIYRRSAGGVSGRFLFNAAVKPLPGFERPKAFVF